MKIKGWCYSAVSSLKGGLLEEDDAIPDDVAVIELFFRGRD